MKRLPLVLMVAALAALLSTADARDRAAVPTSASGDGAIALGEHSAADDDEGGRGVLHFQIQDDEGRVTGSLLFAMEHHHGYPDVVIRVTQIDGAVFEEHTVHFTGKAVLHDEPVQVSGFAFDGEASSRADRFSITAKDPQGTVLVEAEGDLFIGDVRVGNTD